MKRIEITTPYGADYKEGIHLYAYSKEGGELKELNGGKPFDSLKDVVIFGENNYPEENCIYAIDGDEKMFARVAANEEILEIFQSSKNLVMARKIKNAITILQNEKQKQSEKIKEADKILDSILPRALNDIYTIKHNVTNLGVDNDLCGVNEVLIMKPNNAPINLLTAILWVYSNMLRPDKRNTIKIHNGEKYHDIYKESFHFTRMESPETVKAGIKENFEVKEILLFDHIINNKISYVDCWGNPSITINL